MKTFGWLGLFAAGSLAVATFGVNASAPAATPARAADSYEIDASHSAAIFSIKHFGAGNFYGRFNDIKGTFTPDGDKSTIDITVQADSIDTNNDKRDQHLKGPDFFNTKQFPTLTFKSKSVKGAKDHLEITGDFTMHGVTKSITITATHTGEGKDAWGGYRSGYEAKFKIKRADYGINYMPQGLGDDVEIIIALEGVKKKE